MLLCAHDARFFELALLWGQTRMPAIAANLLVWKGNSYSPLTLDVPDAKGRRRSTPTTYV
jgi:type IV secretion system protein VirB3